MDCDACCLNVVFPCFVQLLRFVELGGGTGFRNICGLIFDSFSSSAENRSCFLDNGCCFVSLIHAFALSGVCRIFVQALSASLLFAFLIHSGL